MKHKRWVGSHNWKRSKDVIDGYSSFNERRHSNTQDLDDLIHWLEYANTGYPAARQTVNQEEYWAKLLRNLLCEKLIKELDFSRDNCTFEFKCSHCNNTVRGLIYVDDIKFPISMAGLCKCLELRISDICTYILSEYGNQL